MVEASMVRQSRRSTGASMQVMVVDLILRWRRSMVG